MKRNDDELATNIISEPGRELHYTCLDRDFATTQLLHCVVAIFSSQCLICSAKQGQEMKIS